MVQLKYRKTEEIKAVIHYMNLSPTAFKSISSGEKTIEMRLYDEKRAKIKVGDQIEFNNTATREKIKCIVINLTRYKDFYELYSDNDKMAIGYKANKTANAEDMYAFYSPEQIKEYGVLAIEIKVT